MRDDSARLIRVGIECESLEGDSWGVSRMVRKLTEELARRPHLAATHRFHLYFKSRVPDGPWQESPLFVPVVTTPRWAPSSFNLHYHVWMVLRAYRDGVRALYLPAYQLPLLWFRTSLVMLTEDIWREMRNPRTPLRFRISYAIFANWAARAATRVMAISRASADGISRLFGVPAERIAVNELAVDPPRTAVPTTGEYVLWVGQAFPRRHLRESLEAFAQVARSRPGLSFRVVGPDKYRPAVIADAAAAINRTLGRQAVTWEPWVDEETLASRYAGARALVYVSDAEAFGLPPLEALSYGAVPVVADAPVNREVYGGCAVYAHPTPASIAGALTAALGDGERREEVRRAAPAILARYTWAAHADRFLGIIADIV